MEAEEVTIAPPSWRRRVVLPGLVLALCSAAFVFMPTAQVVQTPNRLEQLIKLQALDQHGVHLDDVVVHGVVDRMSTKPGRVGRYLRRLQSEEMSDAEVLKMLEDAGLSKDCAKGLVETVEMMMKAIVDLMTDIITKCFDEDMVPNGECSEEEMDEMAEKMFGDLMTKCHADGDACNITVADPENAEAAPESFLLCVPQECHKEAKLAVKVLYGEAEELEEEESGVTDPDTKAEDEKKMEEAMTIKCGV